MAPLSLGRLRAYIKSTRRKKDTQTIRIDTSSLKEDGQEGSIINDFAESSVAGTWCNDKTGERSPAEGAAIEASESANHTDDEPHIESTGTTNVAKNFSLKGDEDVESRTNRSFQAPQWFISNCVTTSAQWGERPETLFIRKTNAYGTKRRVTATGVTSERVHEIDAILYEPLQNVVLPSQSCDGGLESAVFDGKGEVHFKHDALLLKSVEGSSVEAASFLKSVVEHFARSISADLITLILDDIEDLAEYTVRSHGQDIPSGTSSYLNMYMPTPFDENGEVSNPSTLKASFPLAQILKSALSTKKNCEAGAPPATASAPLVLLLPQPLDFIRLFDGISHLKSLASIVRGTRGEKGHSRILAISTCEGFQDEILSATGMNPLSEIVEMAPAWSPAHKTWFHNNDSIRKIKIGAAIRPLQREIRRVCPRDRITRLLDPYSDWGFLKDSYAARRLEELSLSSSDIEDTVGYIGKVFEEQHIKEAILRIGCRTEALKDWSRSRDDDDSFEKWSAFPPAIQETIEMIEQSMEYTSEKRFLPLLISPKELDEGWNDIALDPYVKEGILRVVEQPSNQGRPDYGILKRGRVGGALLYGPPGTGKTHLARVLAREFDGVMICATAADLEDMYVGETEKAVKSLFRLAKMLAPSIIFIDEADSLLRCRNAKDPPWESSRVNQILQEMDGLKRSTTAPFVLLASNFPLDLDPAVLRRVPCRLHIGLPSLKTRSQILHIALKDEVLDIDVDLHQLAERTYRFSGSDLQTLCVQAALACNDYIQDGPDEGKRLLSRSHFEDSLERTSPSVSKAGLLGIRSFAKEYDPVALRRILHDEELERDLERKRDHGTSSNLGSPGGFSSVSSAVKAVVAPKTENTAQSFQLPGSSQQLELWRPNVWNFGTSHRNSEIEEHRIEEIDTNIEDSSTNPARPDPGMSSHQKTPLYSSSLNPSQIRVLSIDPEDELQSLPHEISCVLEVVDLDSWTQSYRAFRSLSKLMCESARQRTASWYAFSSAGDRLSRTGDLGESDRERILSDTISYSNSSFDARLEDLGSLDARYQWGDYIALSYVWGDPSIRKTIQVNGQDLAVTANLHSALLRLRDSFEIKERGLKVWIDAICINQKDLAERAREVGKMGRIYSDALSVRAWVGSPSADVAAELPTAKTTMEEIFGTTDILDIQSKLLGTHETAYSIWIVASSLFLESYWERLWVMQEIANAPSLLFWYGENVFTTTEITRLNRLMSIGGLASRFSPIVGEAAVIKISNDIERSFFRILRLRPFKTSMDDKTQLSIFQVLYLAQSAKATDARDKVYGSLTLLPASVSKQIKPDYRAQSSIANVYTSFSKACYQSEGNINLLARVPVHSWRRHGIPSWAFDLTDINKGTLTILEDATFNANRGLSHSLSYSGDSSLVTCHGVFVDIISQLGSSWARERNNEDVQILDIEGEDFDPEWKSTSTLEEIRLSLARTLLQDNSYQFSHGPCILDVPWVTAEDLGHHQNEDEVVRFAMTVQEDHRSEEGRLWINFIRDSPLHLLFRNVLHPNEHFMIRNIPLKDYFSSKETRCADLDTYMDVAKKAALTFNGDRRLLITRAGLLGLGPNFAVPGDKIAVLGACDMPLVLRPKGKYYEVVGSCFVYGLMNGEADQGIQTGQLMAEKISLC